jgi:hypothetical protein
VPNEIFTINLNAQAIIPEAFILLGIVGTLLVDLAGEKNCIKVGTNNLLFINWQLSFKFRLAME